MQPITQTNPNVKWSGNTEDPASVVNGPAAATAIGTNATSSSQIMLNKATDPTIVVKQEPPEEAKNDSGVDVSNSPIGGNTPSPQNGELPIGNAPLSYAQALAVLHVQQNLQNQNSSQQQEEQQPEQQKKAKPKASNSRNKEKTYHCKKCKDFVAHSQEENWNHKRTHMDPVKALYCPLCSFCTEVKHHYEFHMANHAGKKPFACSICPYTCVNKSMLTSHEKSHSEVYLYSCGTCSYHTKYLHSYKIHLINNEHIVGLVLNPDGTVNTQPIDIYGTRRGPRRRNSNIPTVSAAPANDVVDVAPAVPIKRQRITNGRRNNSIHPPAKMSPVSPPSTSSEGASNSSLPLPPTQYPAMLPSPHPVMVPSPPTLVPTISPVPPVSVAAAATAALAAGFQPSFLPPQLCYAGNWPYNFDLINNFRRRVDEYFSQHQQQNIQHFNSNNNYNNNINNLRAAELLNEGALDLRSRSPVVNQMNYDSCDQGDDDDDDDDDKDDFDDSSSDDAGTITTVFPYVEAVVNNMPPSQQPQQQQPTPPLTPATVSPVETVTAASTEKVYKLNCPYCEIGFGQLALYMIHMGLHRSDDPLTCNLCSRTYNNFTDFYSHMIKVPHH